MQEPRIARLLSVLLAAGACFAPAAAPAPAADLDADPRLAVRMTLNEPMIGVRRLLSKVGAECGVPLDAQPELRAETVCLGVADRPCGEILDELTRTLEYRWTGFRTRSGETGYRLTEDPDTRGRLRSLARQYRREAGRELVTQLSLLERFTRELGGSPPGEARERLERLQDRVTGLPVGKERLQAELEYSAAQESTDVTVRPLLLALAALPPASRERLLNGERLVMATRRPGAIPMPAEVVQALRAARQSQAGTRPAGGAGAVRTEDEVIDFLSEVGWGHLTLHVRARWLPGQHERLRFAVPTFLQTPSLVAYGPGDSDLRPGRVTADRPADLQAPVRFAWPAKRLRPGQPLTYYTGITAAEVLGRLAVTDPRWQVSGSALLEGIQPGPAGDPVSGMPARGEPAAALLARLGEKARTGSLPLGELLAPLAERGGVDIRVTRTGWIRFRSTRPFRARERQVDPEALQEVFGPAVEATALTAERAMTAGRLLSRAQLETLSAPHLGFPRHLTQNSGLRHVIDAWRMLDRLPARDREALVRGETLRYAGLKDQGRAAVREYLRSASYYPNGAPLDLELGPRELPTLTLSLGAPDREARVLRLRTGGLEPALYSAALQADWGPEAKQ